MSPFGTKKVADLFKNIGDFSEKGGDFLPKNAVFFVQLRKLQVYFIIPLFLNKALMSGSLPLKFL